MGCCRRQPAGVVSTCDYDCTVNRHRSAGTR